MPLYVLGLMGATRRLDHYDESLGWQGLFIVSAVGVGLIMLGAAFQALQLVISIKDRKKNRDVSGDPWDGRTLEWATTSPAPVYNFAVIPRVETRDAFWEMKQSKLGGHKTVYENIMLPKNSPFPVMIAACVAVLGFSIIWHIWWLVFLALLCAIALVIRRTSDDESEYVLSAEEIKKVEASHKRRYA
jgi:cytochrome o ubiquinol oxidase subunit 1